MDATETDAKIEPAKSSMWDKRLVRLGLFVGTYVAASAITLVLLFLHADSDFSMGQFLDFSDVPLGTSLLLCGLGWLLVPGGLASPFYVELIGIDFIGLFWNLGIWLVACLILLSISLLAIVSKRRRFFVVAYIIFVILLTLGVIGNRFVLTG